MATIRSEPPRLYTAGEQIAQAMWSFNRGLIEKAHLAELIDEALRDYR